MNKVRERTMRRAPLRESRAARKHHCQVWDVSRAQDTSSSYQLHTVVNFMLHILHHAVLSATTCPDDPRRLGGMDAVLHASIL